MHVSSQESRLQRCFRTPYNPRFLSTLRVFALQNSESSLMTLISERIAVYLFG